MIIENIDFYPQISQISERGTDEKFTTPLYNPARCVNHFISVKLKCAIRPLWTIFIIGGLTALVSCASRCDAPLVLPSRNLDKQTQKVCDPYDSAFVETVSSNWWTMLDSKPHPYDRDRGKVVLKFTLHSDGTVTEMKIAKTSTSMKNVNLCEKAVLNGVPYQSWNEAILKALKTNVCDVEFTFEYR